MSGSTLDSALSDGGELERADGAGLWTGPPLDMAGGMLANDSGGLVAGWWAPTVRYKARAMGHPRQFRRLVTAAAASPSAGAVQDRGQQVERRAGLVRCDGWDLSAVPVSLRSHV